MAGLTDEEVEQRLEAVAARLEARQAAVSCRSLVGPHAGNDFVAEGDVLYESWKAAQGDRALVVPKSQRALRLEAAQQHAAEVTAVEAWAIDWLSRGVVDVCAAHEEARLEAEQAAYEAGVVARQEAEFQAREAQRRAREEQRSTTKGNLERAYYASADPKIEQLRREAQERYEAQRAAEAAAELAEIEALTRSLAKYAPRTPPPEEAAPAAPDSPAPPPAESADPDAGRSAVRRGFWGRGPSPTRPVDERDAEDASYSRPDAADEEADVEAAAAVRAREIAVARQRVVDACLRCDSDTRTALVSASSASGPPATERFVAADNKRKARMAALDGGGAPERSAASADTGEAIRLPTDTGLPHARRAPPAKDPKEHHFITTATLD
jgi:hypothetical protein